MASLQFTDRTQENGATRYSDEQLYALALYLYSLKQARLTGALEDYYASPSGVDDKVYIASEHGKVVVLSAAGNWEILAINEFDSDIYATPAISEGRMYIRTQNALYAIASSN